LTEIQWLTVGWLVGSESNKSNNNIDETLVTDNLGWTAIMDVTVQKEGENCAELTI
jgi:hypothetical protein